MAASFRLTRADLERLGEPYRTQALEALRAQDPAAAAQIVAELAGAPIEVKGASARPQGTPAPATVTPTRPAPTAGPAPAVSSAPRRRRRLKVRRYWSELLEWMSEEAPAAPRTSVRPPTAPRRRRVLWPWLLGGACAATVLGFAVLGASLSILPRLPIPQGALVPPPAPAVGHDPGAREALREYYAYVDFSVAQCQWLPAAYVGACVAGAQAQEAADLHTPVATRRAVFAAYTAGRPVNCLELPTDSVAECLARTGG